MNIAITRHRKHRQADSFLAHARVFPARPAAAIATILLVALASGCSIMGGSHHNSEGLAATFVHANKAYEAGRYKQARDAYKRVLKSVPDNVLVLHRLGNASYYLGQYREARGYYQRALADQSNQSLLYFNTAMVDLTTARNNLKHFLRLSGKNSEAIRELLADIDDFADKSAAITKSKNEDEPMATEAPIGIRSDNP